MTLLDWGIVAFALALALWGYQQGLIVGALTLGGFAAGAFIGSRIGPALLEQGSASPYAPLFAAMGALLFGALAAVALEGLALGVRAKVIRGPGLQLADGAARGGADRRQWRWGWPGCSEPWRCTRRVRRSCGETCRNR